MKAEQNNNSRKILFSSFKMGVATFSSRILGLVREQAMAAVFGASGITDAFLVAYRVPNMLRDLFAEGAFSSAFVPIFTEVKHKDSNEARRLLWSLFVLLGGVTSIISILIIIFAPEITSILAPKFLEVPEKFQLTVTLVRIMAPFLVLVSLAALFMGALNALKVFFVPSLAPAFFNVVMIISILVMPKYFFRAGFHPALALGVGVIVGGLIQAFIQFPLILRKRYGPMGPIKLVSFHTKRIVNRVGIGTIGIAATQINILVNTILATSTLVGAVSWLQYAFRLFQFPVGILGVSIAGSNLVHFSDAWKADRKEEAISFLKSSYFLSILVMVPSAVLLYVMSKESVHLIFERGAFLPKDTDMTSVALKLYVIGLPFYGLYKIFAPTFYALDCPKVPVGISIFSIACNIIFCVILTPMYGFWILALGVTLSMMLNCTIQSIFIKRRLHLPINFFFNLKIFKVIAAGTVCFFITRWMTSNWFSYSDDFGSKILFFCLIGLIGMASYAIILTVLGELASIKRVFRRN